MSKSNKARYGTKTKKWKDSMGRSANQARSRAKWKKVKKNTKNPTFGSMHKAGFTRPLVRDLHGNPLYQPVWWEYAP